jgi:hypothetical protein
VARRSIALPAPSDCSDWSSRHTYRSSSDGSDLAKPKQIHCLLLIGPNPCLDMKAVLDGYRYRLNFGIARNSTVTHFHEFHLSNLGDLPRACGKLRASGGGCRPGRRRCGREMFREERASRLVLFLFGFLFRTMMRSRMAVAT